MKKRRIALAVVIALAVLLPTVALAADVPWLPIVPCGSEGQPFCTPCSIVQALKNVSDLVLQGIAGPIAAFIFVLAGGMFLVGSDSPKLQSQAKALMTNTAIGLAILFLAWLGTDFLIKSIATGNATNKWYEFSCPASLTTAQDLSNTLNAPPVPYVPATVPKYLTSFPLSACKSGNYDICPAANTVTCGSCMDRKDNVTDPVTNKTTSVTYETYIRKYAGGAATAGLLNAIMYAESSCSVGASSAAGAYGLMQLLPSTANQFKAGCLKPDPANNGLPSTKPIDAGWLKSGQHVEETICIAAKFINSLVGACGTDPRNLAAGYNSGPGWCAPSMDCRFPEFKSCSGSGPMRAWECPFDNSDHTLCNEGLNETKGYAPKVAVCAQE